VCGAQKAGTSWLSRVMEKNPCFSNGGVKEWHVFNTFFDSKTGGINYIGHDRNQQIKPTPAYIRSLVSQSPSLTSAGKTFTLTLNLATLARYNPVYYFDYFQILADQNKNLSHFGDFTPAYAMLHSTTFKFIKEQFSNRNFIVKPIFIMRDPVDRVISDYNMQLRGKKIDITMGDFLAFAKSNSCIQRTQYEKTLQSLAQSFKREEIYVNFFEKITSCSITQETLHHYLGLDLNFTLEAANTSNQFKGTILKRSELPQEIVVELKKIYHSTYSFVYKHYLANLPSKWSEL